MTSNYNKFISSPRWDELRKARLKIAGYKCENCHKRKSLEVHHKTYERFGGNESMNDLLALCSDCHKIFDEKRKNNESQEIEKPKRKFKSKSITITVTVSQLKNWGEFEARIIEGNQKHYKIKKGYPNSTVNRLYLMGFLEAIKLLPKNKEIKITNKPIWQAVNAKNPKANLDLLAEIKQITKNHKLIPSQ